MQERLVTHPSWESICKELRTIKETQDNYAKKLCLVGFFPMICVGCILHFCLLAEENYDDIPEKDKAIHAAGIPLIIAGMLLILFTYCVHMPAMGASLEKIERIKAQEDSYSPGA
jgi:hypothetical protein